MATCASIFVSIFQWPVGVACCSSLYDFRSVTSVTFVRARFFSNISEHADGERRGSVADLKVPKDASRRDLSDATPPIQLSRRRSPSACAEKLKIEFALG